MSWAAVAGAGIGAAGSFLGGSGGGNELIKPIDMLPGDLKDDYKRVANDFMALDAPEYYHGSTVAGSNPWIDSSLQGMGGFGAGVGGDVMSQQLMGGGMGLDALTGGLGAINNMAARGPNQFAFDQGTFNTTLNNLMPAMQGTYDDMTRDNNRALNWQTLPGLNMANAQSGQQGGTKGAQAGALATAMTNDRNADIGSQLYQNAVNQAQSAGQEAGMANLRSAIGNDSTLLQGFSSLGSLGLPMLNQAWDTGAGNLRLGLGAGEYQRNMDQQFLTDDVNRWNFDQNADANHLERQMNMLNSMTGGTVTQNPEGNPWGDALTGFMAGGGGDLIGSIFDTPYQQDLAGTSFEGAEDWDKYWS